MEYLVRHLKSLVMSTNNNNDSTLSYNRGVEDAIKAIKETTKIKKEALQKQRDRYIRIMDKAEDEQHIVKHLMFTNALVGFDRAEKIFNMEG